MPRLMLAMLAATLCACSHTVVVQVPPRVDLKPYGTLGIVEFDANGERAIGAQAMRQFQEQVQEAQPGTRFLELGTRERLLASVGARELDPAALRKIGEKYGVKGIFLGELAYAEPTTDIKLGDIAKLEAGVRSELRGELSGRLYETAGGASVWTRSAWAKRQLGALSVSAERGVSGGIGKGNPREEMVPSLIYQLTHDFRASTAREPAP